MKTRYFYHSQDLQNNSIFHSTKFHSNENHLEYYPTPNKNRKTTSTSIPIFENQEHDKFFEKVLNDLKIKYGTEYSDSSLQTQVTALMLTHALALEASLNNPSHFLPVNRFSSNSFVFGHQKVNATV